MRPALAALWLAALAAPVAAQQMPTEPPGKPDVTRVKAGTYKVETEHTQLSFGLLHLGFNPYYGMFSQISGSLVLDPAKPAAAKLDIVVPIASLYTTSDRLTAELKAPEWFDARRYPTARFVSTAVEVRGTEARISGNLTLRGVTKPVTLQARFVGAGPNMTKGSSVGFEARGRIKRSEFGLSKGVPLVGDDVGLTVTAAFDKVG